MKKHYKHKNKRINNIVRFVRTMSLVCGISSALMIFSAILITCQMIWVRFVLGGSTIWQTEAVTYLMISATMIGLPYVQLQRKHVNVNLLPLFLSARNKKMLQLFTLSLSFIVILLMVYFGYEVFLWAYKEGWKSDTIWGVTLWRPYLTVPIGFGVYLLQIGTDIIETIAIPANVLDSNKKSVHPDVDKVIEKELSNEANLKFAKGVK